MRRLPATLLTTITAVVVVVLALAFAPSVVGQGTCTSIAYPGSNATYATVINDADDIVGYYFNSDLVDHGFILSGDVYTSVDYPGAAFTALSGINNQGQAVGYAPSIGGFVYDISAHTFTLLGANLAPYALNDAGAVVGTIASTPSKGFELSVSRHREILPPGAALNSLTQLKLLSRSAMIDRRSYCGAAHPGQVSETVWHTSRTRHVHRARVEVFRGYSMNTTDQERWLELCRQIAAEPDPGRLLELAEQIRHLQPEVSESNPADEKSA
jgi:hypothetical protein